MRIRAAIVATLLPALLTAGCSLGGSSSQVGGNASGSTPSGSPSELAALRQQVADREAKLDALQKRLASYVLPDPATPGDLAKTAYLLEKQSRMAVRGAQEAWLSLGNYGKGSSYEKGILDQLRQELASLATDTYAGSVVSAVSGAFAGGEGEFTYPDREDILALDVVSQDEHSVTVRERLREHFPATEFGGGAFSANIINRIELVKTDDGWRLNQVVNESQGGPGSESTSK